MAKNKRSTDDPENDMPPPEGEERERGKAAPPAELPEGFSRVNAVDGPRVWFTAEPGAALRGVLIGRFERRDKAKAYYYQVRATAPCENVKTGDGEFLTADVGAVVTIDEREGLKDLAPLCTMDKQGGEIEVFIRAVEKIKTASGGSFWRWDVGSRRVETRDLPF